MLTEHMPPWPADPEYRHFVDETIVTEEDVAMLLEWMENDMPYGPPEEEPDAPVFDDSGTLLDHVDFVAAIEPYTLQFNTEEYRYFVMSTNFAETKYIEAVEVMAGLPDAVHHADIWIDTSGASADLDEQDPLSGFNGSTGSPSLSTYVNAWQPGGNPARFPENWGIPLPPGADIVFEIHYGPGQAEEIDETYMNIQFVTDVSAVRPVTVGWVLGTNDMTDGPLVIPPNEISTFHQEDQPFWTDKSLIAICPHQHLLGKSYKVWMETPDDETIPLIDIPQWQFHWQLYYTFLNPQKVPAGTTFKSEGVYDNTTANELNPNSPPITVSNGSLTTDEMFLTYFIYADYQEGDELIDLGSVSSLDEKAPAQNVSVYPNPANDFLTVELPDGVAQVQVRVLDSKGRLIAHPFVQAGERIPSGRWAPGVYTVDFWVGGVRYAAQVMKR